MTVPESYPLVDEKRLSIYMLRIILIRPGSTEFDEQRRIKGTLDIPLSETGSTQVARIVEQTHAISLDHVYTSPCRCAQQTAAALAADHKLRAKTLEEFQNLDHGLWHGKLIEEVRQTQPKVYKQLVEHPETVCPPGGEPIGDAIHRINEALTKLIKKHRAGVIALVVPEPVASMVLGMLDQEQTGDLWKSECECGNWEVIDLKSPQVLSWRGLNELAPAIKA